jgi:hypothetical protein
MHQIGILYGLQRLSVSKDLAYFFQDYWNIGIYFCNNINRNDGLHNHT